MIGGSLAMEGEGVSGISRGHRGVCGVARRNAPEGGILEGVEKAIKRWNL